MFIRKNRNRSGSVSIQIVSKNKGRYQVIKTVGSGRTEQEIEILYQRAKIELKSKQQTPSLFVNKSQKVKSRINEETWRDGHLISLKKSECQRLIVSYSDKRANKDSHNRKRGLNRLEKSINRGNLTKSNINNRGYNKYLKIIGDVKIEIDYEKFNSDAKWDGLKGYVTNTILKPGQIIEHYNNLWQIEKAFRISKTDLQIRPIYHRLRHRIEGHICISFAAYCIYKELERILKREKSCISVRRAADLTHNMYHLNVMLPESKHIKSILLKMSQEQSELQRIIVENF